MQYRGQNPLPHTQQSLSVVVHFDLPSTHHIPRKEVAEGSDEWMKSEMPVAYFFWAGGSNTQIIVWILYADPQLAPMWRSLTSAVGIAFLQVGGDVKKDKEVRR